MTKLKYKGNKLRISLIAQIGLVTIPCSLLQLFSPNLRLKNGKIPQPVVKIFIVIAIALLLFSLALSVDSYSVRKSIHEDVFDSYLIISDRGGFDLTPDVVSFGEMRPGDSATRQIYVNNSKGYSVILIASAERELEKFFVNNEVVLKPYENMTLDLVVRAPKDAPLGRYEGRIIVTTRKMSFFNGLL